MKRIVVAFIFFIFTCMTNLAIAGKKISIEVCSDFKNAAGIGYKVNNKEQGSLGNRIKGKGPANETYYFGIRCDSIFGKDLSCGSLFLTVSSKIRLVVNDGECTPEIVS